jgi:hypothetical protein
MLGERLGEASGSVAGVTVPLCGCGRRTAGGLRAVGSLRRARLDDPPAMPGSIYASARSFATSRGLNLAAVCSRPILRPFLPGPIAAQLYPVAIWILDERG